MGFCRARGYQGFFRPHTQARKTAVLFTLPPSPMWITAKPQGRVAVLAGIRQHSKGLQTRGGIDTDHA